MSNLYKPEIPADVTVNPGIRSFFEQFYRQSDTPSDHQAYADHFTDDATFILASKVSRGRSEILSTREGMWTNIASRKHTPAKLFPFGTDSREFMLYGDVDFTFKNGGEGKLPWAARAELVQTPDGLWKMGFYQIYLVSCPSSSQTDFMSSKANNTLPGHRKWRLWGEVNRTGLISRPSSSVVK